MANPFYNMNVKALLNDFLKEKADRSGEYVQAASVALKRSGFERIEIFDYNGQLVMINMNASMNSIVSGIVLDENDEIERFQTSDDYKSVSVNAVARCLIMESVEQEMDIVRLRALSKDKCSWVIHYLTNDVNEKNNVPKENWYPAYMCNAHTHGLMAGYNHRDFQLVLDVGPNSTGFTLNALAERVRNGEIFADGEVVEGIYQDSSIKLALAKEGGREVFRVLIPDENGRYPGDEGCKFPFSLQEKVLE